MLSCLSTLLVAALACGDPALGAALERGPGELVLEVPRAERLDYTVVIDLGAFEVPVGRLTLRAGVAPYEPGILAPSREERADAEVPWYESRATGSHFGYEMDHRITVRHLPQAFPRVLVRDTQRGTENRRRELRFGTREGASFVSYRSDRHCDGCDARGHFVHGSFPWSSDHHCGDCDRGEHRVWKEPVERDVPRDAVDMLGAVYLARSFVRTGHEEARFPIVERHTTWDVTLKRGERRVIRTSAGRFATRRVALTAQAPEDTAGATFRGLFGIHGDLRIYVHERTGVPVWIEGSVPLGPLVLGARVKLKEWEGAPAGFGPLE